jgi:peptide methionine sulfoxide reductase msrA/msrB
MGRESNNFYIHPFSLPSMKYIFILIIILLFTSCTTDTMKQQDLSQYEIATLAGGCFWCIEGAFQGMEGVAEAISGYAGGTTVNPKYEDVAYGQTDHRETVQVYFDPAVVSYKELVEHFWKQIDPTDTGGQFADRGFQYTTAIFYHSEEQKQVAEASKKALIDSQKFSEPIDTKIIPFTTFYTASEDHQDYSEKRRVQYKLYEEGSGRAGYKRTVWGSKN